MGSSLVFVEKWPVEGRRHAPEAGASIGRADCDVVLADPDVSRRHAMIRAIDGALGVEDVGSRNGTFVNGSQISGATVLKVGDEVRFGNTVWRVESAPAS